MISAIGLDFSNDNPQYRASMDQFMDAARMSLGHSHYHLKELAFFGCWILTKVFIFDFGAIFLALSAGILFNNVLYGALLSALGSTIGSSAAYFLARTDTPARRYPRKKECFRGTDGRRISINSWRKELRLAGEQIISIILGICIGNVLQHLGQ